MRQIFVGTAGWSIPTADARLAPGGGSHLERYARVLPCTEINSSFHRPHAPAVYARWAAATPPAFRFAIKMPRVITHDQRLRRARTALERFLDETSALGDKRGPVLVQLPPSLAFERRVAIRFFELLREHYDGIVVCEPRNATWFEASVSALLVRFQIARVGADPPPTPGADRPGGWRGIVYFRQHGSPRKYWSLYPAEHINALTDAIEETEAPTVWCVFDNTAGGGAFANACDLRRRLV